MGGLLFIGVLVLIALVVIGIYNRLVGLRQNCRQGLADIDAQLRQRHDLVPNLVATVKGYAAHEQATFEQVIDARNHATASATPEAERELTKAIGSLLALGEAYPDLKASANFQALQGELADVEDKLAAARRALNAAAARYNSAREGFPAVLFAGAMGFAPADFHTLAGEERATVGAVPSVQF
ncbi:MAG: LemA family protein [Novosphingobium sp.]|uniref:LemA family protein n=1 Tax=Novosphingobium sp. TaxID=1874826 RepID=UPI0018379B3F|nr:LemA family protein [Novosphingobium sp.]